MAPPDFPRPVLADPAAVYLAALDSFLPADPIPVHEWAARHRWVTGARTGLWSNAVAPYLTEPMQGLTSGEHSTTALVGPGQCGKTAIAENWLLHTIDTDPAPFGWYANTDDVVRAYVKNTINPLIEQHEAVAAKRGHLATDDSLSFKGFRGMTVQFLAAIRANLINKTFARIVADEYDAYNPDLGDARTLLDVRRQTWGRDSHLLLISHPDRAQGAAPGKWTAGIMAVYAASTRCTWWWPCPHCGAWSSPNPGTARHMTLTYPEDAPLDVVQHETRLCCPVNNCQIDDADRRAMNAAGRWIARGESIDEAGTVTGQRDRNDIAGYWITGTMSPFLLHGIGGLAANRVKAQRDAQAEGDDRGVREVVVKQWGLPYDPVASAGQVDAETLAARADDRLSLGIVPDGVRFLTAAVDVQANRFELLVRGWGEGAESWIIDHRRIEAAPATSADDWDDLTDLLAGLAYPLAGAPGREMRCRAAGIDSGGEAGVTEQCYAAWRRARLAGHTRRLGNLAGRDLWTLLPLKGLSGPNAPRLQVVYPDTARKDRRASARGEIPLGQFNPNIFKDALSGQLARALPGPGYVHIPEPLKRGAAPTFIEQMVAERRLPNGKWESNGGRNEATDLMVMSHAIAHLHGLSRIDWRRPPAWAEALDRNTMVRATLTDAEAPPAPVAAVNMMDARRHVAPAPVVVVAASHNPAARRGGFSGRLA